MGTDKERRKRVEDNAENEGGREERGEKRKNMK